MQFNPSAESLQLLIALKHFPGVTCSTAISSQQGQAACRQQKEHHSLSGQLSKQKLQQFNRAILTRLRGEELKLPGKEKQGCRLLRSEEKMQRETDREG